MKETSKKDFETSLCSICKHRFECDKNKMSIEHKGNTLNLYCYMYEYDKENIK